MASSPAHIVEVLRALRDSHLAPSIRVFGSAALGSTLANDVDIALDLRGLTPQVAGMGARYDAMNMRAEISRLYHSLLSLAARHYGRLDPFLITDHGLFARNLQATNWVKARNAAQLVQAINTTSVPLASVLTLYDVRHKASQFQGPMADPVFRRWFGSSKAVNVATGEPLVLFHGTGADVGAQFRPGTFFTALPAVADIYARAPTRQTAEAGPNISPVFLSVQSPYVFDDVIINDNLSHHILGKRSKLDAVFSKLMADGHDGLFIKNYHDLGGVQDQYVIFRSSQVKTAIGWHCAPKPAPKPAQLELLDIEEGDESHNTTYEACHG